jgi:hypothetical protein
MTVIRSRRSMGSKTTGAAPKPEEHGWRCWATNSAGNLLCEPGPDGLPKLIYGGSTPEAAADAHLRHMLMVHPTAEQRSAASVRYRRPVQTVQPRWST